MTDHVHWWLAALSFVLGLTLTLTSLVRPAKTRMPAWVFAEPTLKPTREPAPPRKPDPTSRPKPKPEPKSTPKPTPKPTPKTPEMKTTSADVPTKQLPAVQPTPPRKAGAKPPPKKRRPVSADAATQRIRVPRDQATERIPVIKDPATEQIPVIKKRPAKRPAGATPKSGPKRPPAKRTSSTKDGATRRLPASEAPTTVMPLMPYAPYGAGSMRANADGSGPDGWLVKGRTDSRLFFTPDDEGYDDTEAHVWFETEELAGKAFFTAWSKSARKA